MGILSKKLTLKTIVDSNSHGVLLYKEIIGDVDNIVYGFGKMFVGFVFLFLGAMVSSIWLLIGWSSMFISCSNYLSFELGLGTILYSQDLYK